MKHPQNDHEDHPSWHKNSYMFCDQKFKGKPIKTETTTWSKFSKWGKAITEQILASEERKKCKRAGLWAGRIQRFWKGGSRGRGWGKGVALYVGHHRWPTKKILGFRWSRKAKRTLETKVFGETFLSVF